MSGQLMGTPAYMSPEQCRNAKRVSEKTDVYAIGIMLAEMVTGKPPFKAGNVHDLMAKQVNDAPKLGQVPAALKPLVESCLEKPVGSRPTRSKLKRPSSPCRQRTTLMRHWLNRPSPNRRNQAVRKSLHPNQSLNPGKNRKQRKMTSAAAGGNNR